MKPWALVTGASTGIGRELATLLASDGINVVLLARNESRLREAAADLEARHRVQTRVVVKDLARPGAAREIFNELRDCPIEILVNNAGFGLYGRFVENELEAQTDIMQVNMTALVELTHLFVKPMLERRSGRILNVASTAAFQPGPLISVYYASKAFVHSFSYALTEELRGTGVTVTALCPGTTHTEFFARGNFGDRRAPFTMNAGDVARIGYRAMKKGKPVVISGWINWIAACVARRLPAAWTMAVVRKVHRLRRPPRKTSA